MSIISKLFIGILGTYGLAHVFRGKFNSWGATEEEKKMSMPGESQLTNPKIASTHAVTIYADPPEIWPWLIQIGVGRGGFYSYAWLENLVGSEVENVDRIVPEFQDLSAGDFVYLHPKASPLKVTHFEKNKSLALEGWMFHLKSVGPKKTRLIARTYTLPSQQIQNLPWKFFDMGMKTVWFDFAHFIMERKQLKEIKRLVESRPRIQEAAVL